MNLVGIEPYDLWNPTSYRHFSEYEDIEPINLDDLKLRAHVGNFLKRPAIGIAREYLVEEATLFRHGNGEFAFSHYDFPGQSRYEECDCHEITFIDYNYYTCGHCDETHHKNNCLASLYYQDYRGWYTIELQSGSRPQEYCILCFRKVILTQFQTLDEIRVAHPLGLRLYDLDEEDWGVPQGANFNEIDLEEEDWGLEVDRGRIEDSSSDSGIQESDSESE
jgi:hypothetical protein